MTMSIQCTNFVILPAIQATDFWLGKNKVWKAKRSTIWPSPLMLGSMNGTKTLVGVIMISTTMMNFAIVLTTCKALDWPAIAKRRQNIAIRMQTLRLPCRTWRARPSLEWLKLITNRFVYFLLAWRVHYLSIVTTRALHGNAYLETHVSHREDAAAEAYGSIKDVPTDVIHKVDDMTKKDRILYQAAVRRFTEDIKEVELRFGKKILCNSELQRLQNKTTYKTPEWLGQKQKNTVFAQRLGFSSKHDSFQFDFTLVSLDISSVN